MVEVVKRDVPATHPLAHWRCTVERRIGPMSDSKAEKIADGIRVNLDRKNYYVRVVYGTANFERFLAAYKAAAAAPDATDNTKALLELFETHKDDIGQHFDSTLEYMASEGADAAALREWFGAVFQKGFRQADIIDDGSHGVTDMKVYRLLSPDAGTVFWQVLLMEPTEVRPCPYCVGRIGRVCTTCEDCQGSGVVAA